MSGSGTSTDDFANRSISVIEGFPVSRGSQNPFFLYGEFVLAYGKDGRRAEPTFENSSFLIHVRNGIDPNENVSMDNQLDLFTWYPF